MGEVRYGTAGWVFDDWYGTFYPAPRREEGPGSLFTGVLETPPDPDVRLARRRSLSYYARYFDLIEVNSSFYRVPSSSTTEGWAEQTEEREGAPFLFSFKLPMTMSHEGWLEPGEVSAFRECLAPIQARDRLAAVLVQFPHRFSFTAPSQERLERIRAELPDLPLVVEVRHKSWQAEPARELIAGLELCWANVDQPQDETTLGPTTLVTTPQLAYVRLHGRNAAAWFDRKAGRDQKYDYLYDRSELSEWAGRIEQLAELSKRTLVIANNHFRGQAPANALELRALREGPQQIPPALRETYPRLCAGAETPRSS